MMHLVKSAEILPYRSLLLATETAESLVVDAIASLPDPSVLDGSLEAVVLHFEEFRPASPSARLFPRAHASNRSFGSTRAR